jgi:hypothetical protein
LITQPKHKAVSARQREKGLSSDLHLLATFNEFLWRFDAIIANSIVPNGRPSFREGHLSDHIPMPAVVNEASTANALEQIDHLRLGKLSSELWIFRSDNFLQRLGEDFFCLGLAAALSTQEAHTPGPCRFPHCGIEG